MKLKNKFKELFFQIKVKNINKMFKTTKKMIIY